MAGRRSMQAQDSGGQGAEVHARRRLLKAARTLLSTVGPQGATARAICDAAGVRAPTLYYYFGDLPRLHRAAVNASFLEIMAGYRRLSRSSGAVAAVQQAWHAFLHFARAEPLMARLLIQSVIAGHMPPALHLTLTRLRGDMDKLAASGDLSVPPSVAVGMLWTASVGAVSLASGENVDEAAFGEIADALLDAVMAGLLPRAANRD